MVADQSRTDKTICLAVSPALKACGIPGRPRLFEVVQKVRQINAQRQRLAPGHRFSKEDAQPNFSPKSDRQFHPTTSAVPCQRACPDRVDGPDNGRRITFFPVETWNFSGKTVFLCDHHLIFIRSRDNVSYVHSAVFVGTVGGDD